MSTTIEDEGLRKNYGYLVIGILLAFLILLSKIWYLQIIKGGEFAEAADSNRTRTIRLAAPRGVIRDRNGQILVDNRPSFDVYFHPTAIKGKTEEESRSQRLRYLEKVAAEMEVDFSLLKKRFNQAGGKAPIKVKTDITWEDVARINAASVTIDGDTPLRVEDETKRVYPYEKLLCHFLGYVAEIDQRRLDSPNYVGYRPGDLVGKVGLEDRYEPDLKGAFGRKVIEENARNVELRTLDIMPPIPGKNLVLNVDIDLVKAADKAMRAMNNLSGAVIALDVRTGGVLCALSVPGYNPEIFSRVLSTDTWNGLLNNPKKPLANKAIGNAYPPGSTWKVVTAIAGLESKEIKPSWLASCAGRWKYGDRYFRCWNERGHGTTNLHRAIVRSCDVFFYKLSLKVGVDEIAHWAKLLGAGEKTGIDATPETKGTIPSREWKLNTIGEEWIAGETLSCAIGQGYNQVSAVQLALIYASIANGGTVYRPQVVDRIEDPDGNLVDDIQPEIIRTVQFKKNTLPPIIRGLTGVVNEVGGTGSKSKLKKVLVAGKTGTAQVRRIHKTRIHISNMEWEARDHAWFAAFAPAENPEIAVVVLAEHSGHGGTAAAPVAGAVLGEYFRKKDRAATAPPVDQDEAEESN
jgi:penicillin-binding protein 2